MNLKRIALASIAVAAIASAPAFAACPDPAPTFGTLINTFCGGGTTFCEVQSPAGGFGASGRFWGWNQADFGHDQLTPQCPNASCGADNGNFASNDVDAAWLLSIDEGSGPVPGRYWIISDWAGAGVSTDKIDGCPTASSPKTVPIMMIGLSDTDALGNGYLAIAWSARMFGVQKADYDFSVVNKSAPPNEASIGTGDIILRAVPRPFVTASARTGPTSHDFSIRSLVGADLSNMLYGDNSMTEAEAISGFKIYTRIVPRNAPIPANTRSAWTQATGVLPLGSPDTVIPVNCPSNSDVYFAYSIVARTSTDGGVPAGSVPFEAAVVGTSRKGQCGPTIAEPQDPKIKPIDRPKKNVNPNN